MSSPRIAGLIAFALLLVLPAAQAGAAADTDFERMVICKDSWHDWQRTGDGHLQKLAAHLSSGYTQKAGDPFFVPKTPTTVLGFRVLQVYPGSVGMGVGFSILVDATFDKARKGLEHTIGKPLQKCETSDGMKTCELQIAAQRTISLMSMDDPKNTSALLGCYYFYEK